MKSRACARYAILILPVRRGNVLTGALSVLLSSGATESSSTQHAQIASRL